MWDAGDRPCPSGIARSVAYSANGGLWFTPPLPYGATAPKGACAEIDVAGEDGYVVDPGPNTR